MLTRKISKLLPIMFLAACFTLLINNSVYADNKKPQEAKAPEWEWLEKGNALFVLGKYQDAVKAYSKAIELNQKVALFYNNRGYSYRHLNKFEEAIADYSRAIKVDPKYAGAYNNRGVAYGKHGQS